MIVSGCTTPKVSEPLNNGGALTVFRQQKIIPRVDNTVSRSIRRDTLGDHTILHLQVQLRGWDCQLSPAVTGNPGYLEDDCISLAEWGVGSKAVEWIGEEG
jgi:hypothetical protein